MSLAESRTEGRASDRVAVLEAALRGLLARIESTETSDGHHRRIRLAQDLGEHRETSWALRVAHAALRGAP